MRVIDLFAGCGGFSLGFKQAGFEIIKAVEYDKQIADTYIYNHTNTKMIVENIKNIDNSNFFSKHEADVIIGGPPCQGFSMAGARIRKNNFKKSDNRNYLFKHYLNVVKIVRPQIFVMENVKGIINQDQGKVFQTIIDEFSNHDNFNGDKYELNYRVVNACDFGIPQKRERIIIIGVLNNHLDLDKLFALTKERILSENNFFFDMVSVWDAISDLQNFESHGELSSSNKNTTRYQKYLQENNSLIYNHVSTNHNKTSVNRMKKIKAGDNYLSLKGDKIRSVHSGAYGRLMSEQLANTITTRFDTPSGGRFIHQTLNRTITAREAARLQSFPDHIRFYGGKNSICTQIGNAVPPKLSYFIGMMVKIYFEQFFNRE